MPEYLLAINVPILTGVVELVIEPAEIISRFDPPTTLFTVALVSITKMSPAASETICPGPFPTVKVLTVPADGDWFLYSIT